MARPLDSRRPALIRPALSVILASVNAAMPTRTRPLNPMILPSMAPPTNATAGKTSFRASMFFTPCSRGGNAHAVHSVPDAREWSNLSMIPRVKPEGMLFRKPASTPDQVRGRLFPDHALQAPPDKKAGDSCDDQGAEDLLARALPHEAAGVVHRLLARLRNCRRGVLQIDDGGRAAAASLRAQEGKAEKQDAEHRPRAAKNAERTLRPDFEPQPFIESRDAEAERQQDQNRPDGGKGRRHDGLANLALEVDADQAQHGAEHQRRPLRSPITNPTQRAPATTPSGLRRATRSSSATMELA